MAKGRGIRLRGLGFRLMTLMGAALLPLAILSYVQTLAAESVAESRARAAILGETLLAASPQIDLLMQATGTVQTLASTLPQVAGDVDACTTFVRRVAGTAGGHFSFVGFIPPDGNIECTTADEAYDMAGSPWLAEMLADPELRLTVNRNGPISGTSILNLSAPVFGPDERLIGFASVSMAHSAIAARSGVPRLGGDAPLVLLTFDDEGEVLTSSVGMDAAPQKVPVSRPLAGFVGLPGSSFIDTAVSGQRRAFAVVPLSPGKLYLLGSWPADRLEEGGLAAGLPSLTFPLLMWASSLLVAWLAAESQVLRHVRALRDSITAFAGGNRRVPRLDNDAAALEIREAGDAYEQMTEAILHNEAQLENTIHQKEVLLRELHHRVKNNLQLIASILNMQLRGTTSPETQAAMKSVQERVVGLATIHRELYQTSGLADIRADELLPRISRHILRIGSAPERRLALDLDIEDIRLTPDQAVPLALFLTEGVTNALKHIWQADEAGARIAVQFERLAEGMALLTLRNTVLESARSEDLALDSLSDGFGIKLLSAFALQLDGEMTRRRVGRDFVLRLSFPLQALHQGEHRVAPSPQED